MTYNVFSGTLNPVETKRVTNIHSAGIILSLMLAWFTVVFSAGEDV